MPLANVIDVPSSAPADFDAKLIGSLRHCISDIVVDVVVEFVELVEYEVQRRLYLVGGDRAGYVVEQHVLEVELESGDRGYGYEEAGDVVMDLERVLDA